MFSWAFELTPEGVKSTREVDRDESITHNTGRKLDRMIIAILAIAVAWFAWDKFGRDDAKPIAVIRDAPTIAVLPFVNMSASEENAYFSDGISEELLNTIVKLDVVDVIGRTSSFQFKGQNLDLREIGRTLNASHILEGSVRRAGNRVRITAQLIEAASGTHLWSDSYDRELADVFRVQAEVAKAIASELHLNLGAEPSTALSISSGEAYDLYLKSIEAIQEHSFGSLRNAEQWLDRAIQLDPDFGLLYVAKARVVLDQSRIGIVEHAAAARVAMPLLDKAAEKGADRDAYWHHSMSTALNYLGRRAEARQAIERAYELNPKDVRVLNSYAAWQRLDEGPEAAIALLETSVRLDPLNYWTPFMLGGLYANLLDHERARHYKQCAIELAPASPTANAFFGIYLLNSGEVVEGLQMLVDGIELDPSDPEGFTFPATAFLSLGLYDEAWDMAGREDALRAVQQRLEATLTNPDTLFRRIGPKMNDLNALLELERGNPEAAYRVFRENLSAPFDVMLGDEPPPNDLRAHWAPWETLATYVRLARAAGDMETVARLAPRLEWIDEDAAIKRFGGALNPEALWFLVETRAGFVDEIKVFEWIEALHDEGAFFTWRSRLQMSSGLRMLEDQDTLASLTAGFDASVETARAEWQASQMNPR